MPDFLSDLLISTLSSGFSKSLIAPIERVKLLLQLQDASSQLSAHSRYTGVWNCTTRVLRDQGLLSFWRGNLSNVVRYVPSTAFAFATKDWFKRTFCGFDPEKEELKFFWGNIASGGFAGAAAALLTYPLDFTRTRLAADIGKKRSERLFVGALDCIAKVYKTDGIEGLYRGISLALPVFVLYRALYFGLYDSWTYSAQRQKCTLSPISRLLIAVSVTTTASLALYPFDTIRRRLMMQSGRSDLLYSGIRDCIRKIYAAEGLKGYFKGGLVNLIRSSGGAVCLVLYDLLKLNTHSGYLPRLVTRICTGLPRLAGCWRVACLRRIGRRLL